MKVAKSISLDKTLLALAEEAAKLEDRNLSNFIAICIREKIERDVKQIASQLEKTIYPVK